MDIHAEKSALRRTLRRARQRLAAMSAGATRRIQRHLFRHIKRGARIGVYWPIGSELRLDDFIQTALQRGARVYLPYIEPGRLRLWFTPYCADAAQAERARGRLKMPQFHGEKIRAHRLNTLLLPLVGIDNEGYRLGQGGGYYDASLAATRHRLQPHTIGVGTRYQRHNGRLPRNTRHAARWLCVRIRLAPFLGSTHFSSARQILNAKVRLQGGKRGHFARTFNAAGALFEPRICRKINGE